ncbi:aspartyl protease family protein [Winogradskyella sp.]|uniref:retropepsin-like aspartic protease n=1 Tax=Winogradskyella sp. TaxID=1883156 RepID=UPI00263431FC|nr:aspartyl protease family protein [Winogradskyella sp.]
MKSRFLLFISLLFTQLALGQKFQDTIPFRNDLGLIIIPISFNGVEKQFAFDTGAEYSVAYDWAKDELKRTNKIISVVSSSGLRSKMRFYKSGNISIGSRKITGHRILNTAENDIFSCHKVDGILGVDIIKELNWKIDFKQKILIMYPSNHIPNEVNSMHQLDFVFTNNHPYMYLKRKKSRLRFLLDTGAGKSSNISQKDYNLTTIDSFPHIEVHSGSFDVNGVFTTTTPRVFQFPESTSKDVTLSPVIYYNNLKSSKIGNYLWGELSLFLSLKKNKLYVSSSHIKQDYDYHSCYVSYYNGAIRIISIVKGSDVWNLGARQGDEIVLYNEKKFTDFCTLNKYQRQLIKLGEPITIQLKSGETVTISKKNSFQENHSPTSNNRH